MTKFDSDHTSVTWLKSASCEKRPFCRHFSKWEMWIWDNFARLMRALACKWSHFGRRSLWGVEKLTKLWGEEKRSCGSLTRSMRYMEGKTVSHFLARLWPAHTFHNTAILLKIVSKKCWCGQRSLLDLTESQFVWDIFSTCFKFFFSQNPVCLYLGRPISFEICYTEAEVAWFAKKKHLVTLEFS